MLKFLSMKQLFLISLASIALLFVSACNDAAKPINISRASTPAPPVQQPGVDSHGHTEGADAPRISLADAKKAFDDGSAVFIDTHLKNAYDEGHIPGALNISVAELDLKFDTIPKGKKIIAYCS
jgi:3-mercaptopyruvate sulfurtransferase SseA